MKAAKEVILITAGDPASISTEITIKAAESHRISKNINLVAITDPKLVEECKKLINSNIKINEIKDEIKFSDYKENCFNIIPITLNNRVEYGNPDLSNLYTTTKWNSLQTLISNINTFKEEYNNYPSGWSSFVISIENESVYAQEILKYTSLLNEIENKSPLAFSLLFNTLTSFANSSFRVNAAMC